MNVRKAELVTQQMLLLFFVGEPTIPSNRCKNLVDFLKLFVPQFPSVNRN